MEHREKGKKNSIHNSLSPTVLNEKIVDHSLKNFNTFDDIGIQLSTVISVENLNSITADVNSALHENSSRIEGLGVPANTKRQIDIEGSINNSNSHLHAGSPIKKVDSEGSTILGRVSLSDDDKLELQRMMAGNIEIEHSIVSPLIFFNAMGDKLMSNESHHETVAELGHEKKPKSISRTNSLNRNSIIASATVTPEFNQQTTSSASGSHTDIIRYSFSEFPKRERSSSVRSSSNHVARESMSRRPSNESGFHTSEKSFGVIGQNTPKVSQTIRRRSSSYQLEEFQTKRLSVSSIAEHAPSVSVSQRLSISENENVAEMDELPKIPIRSRQFRSNGTSSASAILKDSSLSSFLEQSAANQSDEFENGLSYVSQIESVSMSEKSDYEQTNVQRKLSLVDTRHTRHNRHAGISSGSSISKATIAKKSNVFAVNSGSITNTSLSNSITSLSSNKPKKKGNGIIKIIPLQKDDGSDKPKRKGASLISSSTGKASYRNLPSAKEKVKNIPSGMEDDQLLLLNDGNIFANDGKISWQGKGIRSSSFRGVGALKITDNEVITRFFQIFIEMKPEKRGNLLLDIIRQCDPADMALLNEKIPMFHRDFLTLCEPKIVFRILDFIKPRDIVTVSGVSRKWNELMLRKETWYALYSSLGLASMAEIFYLKDGTVSQNSILFSSICNWARGIFSYRFFQPHMLGILCMSFDGRTVATGSSDMICKLSNIKTGATLRSFLGHEGSIHTVQHDTKKVVTGSSDNTIKIWSCVGVEESIATFKCHSGPITCLKMRGKILVSGSEDRTVRLWDLEPIEKRWLTPKEEPGIAESPKVKRAKPAPIVIAEGTDDEKCCQRILHGHESAIKALDFLDNVLITGDIRGIVMIWHLSSGNCINIFGFHYRVQKPIQIGINELTEMKNKNHEKILTEPIAEIQYSKNSLLVSTLSGYAFMSEVKPPPIRNASDPILEYNNTYAWANDPETFKQKPTFHLCDSPLKSESAGMQGKWSLCSKNDDWRLMTGGSQGYLTVYNHRIGKFIYRLYPASAPSEDEEATSPDRFAKRNKSKTLTGIAFDDDTIVSVGMQGKDLVSLESCFSNCHANSSAPFQLAANLAISFPRSIKISR